MNELVKNDTNGHTTTNDGVNEMLCVQKYEQLTLTQVM